MKVIHDIRQQIPQFSANYFPPYTYQPYPRMMVNKETGKPYLDKQKKPVIVQDEHEEKLFLAGIAPAPKVVEVAESPMTMDVSAEPIKRGPGRPPMPKNLTA